MVSVSVGSKVVTSSSVFLQQVVLAVRLDTKRDSLD